MALFGANKHSKGITSRIEDISRSAASTRENGNDNELKKWTVPLCDTVENLLIAMDSSCEID